MKALFVIFHGFSPANGISKKIHYQVKALQECGITTELCHYWISEQGHRYRKIDQQILSDLGNGIIGKIKKRCCYNDIYKYCENKSIPFVYIRSDHNANPFTLNFVKKLKAIGTKVVMEIPTYPYDQEYVSFRMKIDLFVDKCFRKQLASHLDRIVTFSNAQTIFGKQTLCISNGIDFDSICLKQRCNNINNELHLIGVAEVHFWHGYDRLIKGLAEYYKGNPTYKVYFHIVGEISSERDREDILPIIKDNHLEQYVILHGARHGKELDELFEQADFAIGSLGRHRSGITYIKTLKNREYAARGMAFIYSEIDDDFEEKPFILKATADESPINIKQIIEFRRNLSLSPIEIRASIQNLSWKEQMNRVIQELEL